MTFIRLGSHQVAKLQHMVENTRQRLLDLKHSQKTVDRSYHTLQVRFLFIIHFNSLSSSYSSRRSITKPNMILMKPTISIDN